jgi:hypothetical protein
MAIRRDPPLEQHVRIPAGGVTIDGETRLEIVPGATHLFEEPGALDHVALLARDWFLRYLKPVPVGNRSHPRLLTD